MGCGGSKGPGLTLQIDTSHSVLAQSSEPGFDSPSGAASISTFNSLEEADEKALQDVDTMYERVSLGIGVALPPRDSFASDAGGTLDDQVEDFRAEFDTMVPLNKLPPMAGSPQSLNASGCEHSGSADLVNNYRWRSFEDGALATSHVNELFEALLSPEFTLLPRRLVWRVVLDAIRRIKDDGPVAQVPAPSRASERQIIVGDTHGQLQDVLHILITHGKPSTTNRYIFNGDIADRGPDAIEILVLAILVGCKRCA